MSDDDGERELTEQVINGDHDALAVLFSMHRDPVSYTHLTLPTIYSV